MREIISLNKGWFFKKRDAVPAVWPGDHGLIDLPHTWNNLDGQDGGGDYWRGRAAYTRKLEIEKSRTRPISSRSRAAATARTSA